MTEAAVHANIPARPWSGKFLTRSYFNPIATLVVLLSLLASALYWWQLTSSADRLRAETIAQAEFRASQLNGAVADEIAMLFHNVDFAARELSARYVPGRVQDFAAEVREVEERLPERALLQVAVIDPDGYLSYSSLGMKERVFLGDREHFKVHLGSTGDQLFISKPVLGRVSREWSIQFTRPIRRNGKFLGVVVLSVAPSYLQQALVSLTLASDDSISIFRASGEYLARNRDHEALLGKSFGPDRPFVGETVPATGSFRAPANYDQVHRIYRWQRLRDYPVTIVLGLSEQSVLRPVEAVIAQDRRSALIGTSLLWVFSLGLVFLLARMTRQQQLVLENGTQLRLMTDSVKDYAIIMIDGSGRVVSWNEGARRLKGYDADEILGAPMARFHTPEDVAAGRPGQIIAAAVRDGRCEDAGWRVRKDGSRFYADVALSAMRDSAGRLVGLVNITRDITERNEQQLQLRRAKEAAEAASVAKSRFLATISHELRTPMNGILGMAQVLLMPGVSEAERANCARTILDSGQTLLGLLNDILDLSKAEANRIELEPTVFDPAALLDEIRRLYGEPAARKKLSIDAAWNGPGGQPYVGDAQRLRQMLANLVNNAIKFTERGAVRIAARELSRDEHGALLEFEVVDTGIGIPADKQSLMFQPFTQVDSSTTRQYGGSGLGLSIVHRLALLMGGEVGVDSRFGQGSRFWFRVRVALPDVDAKSTPASPAGPGEAFVPRAASSARVLVVEDNAVNRRVVEAMLTRFGLSVCMAEDGRQGFDCLLRGEMPDLVLMDVQMPVMDGYAATRAIRLWEAEHGRRRLPIVALTADAFEKDRQDCLAAGMDDFLTKPLAIDKLAAVLEKWLPGGTISPQGARGRIAAG
ncbi:ATP-binding protein [Rhodocyclus purpureus]|uniref:ATP-binding protein n=1 Tax=Rhodocyclus purpureus TaxID=1067 RepID=UPI0019122CBC|nr:ATP-binding protein [Rhodocyclus purpureus]MBK5914467.1 hypothetical protein [Rhodocyclus purpureus]